MVWGHEAESDANCEILRRLNRLEISTIVRVPLSTPTKTMELALDVLPLHIYIIKIGLAAYHRLHDQVNLTWEGVFDNLTHSVSHLRFWQYLFQDFNLTADDPNIEECYVVAPRKQFALDANSFVDMDNAQSPAHFNIYTDGSKKNGKVGAGAVLFKSNVMIKELSCRLPDEATVFQAELMAIREAATAISAVPSLTTIKFYVNSQAVLRALQMITITSKVALQTIQAINTISATSIIFVWTKAHIGNPGNERADHLAKQGTLLHDILNIPLPATSDSVLADKIADRWLHVTQALWTDKKAKNHSIVPHLKFLKSIDKLATDLKVDNETIEETIDDKNYWVTIDSKKGKTKPIPLQINDNADGSKTKQGAGSGFVIMKGKDTVLHTQSINLTGEAMIFQAELIAIQEAAKHLHENEDIQGLYVKFFSDSQAALMALKTNKCKATTVKETHEALNDLAINAKLVRLTWIKAHVGLDGNELADEYAK